LFVLNANWSLKMLFLVLFLMRPNTAGRDPPVLSVVFSLSKCFFTVKPDSLNNLLPKLTVNQIKIKLLLSQTLNQADFLMIISSNLGNIAGHGLKYI
jgi:hypothetical protein